MTHKFLLNIGWHEQGLSSIDLMRSIPRYKAMKANEFFEMSQRSDMNHDSGSTKRQAEYPNF